MCGPSQQWNPSGWCSGHPHTKRTIPLCSCHFGDAFFFDFLGCWASLVDPGKIEIFATEIFQDDATQCVADAQRDPIPIDVDADATPSAIISARPVTSQKHPTALKPLPIWVNKGKELERIIRNSWVSVYNRAVARVGFVFFSKPDYDNAFPLCSVDEILVSLATWNGKESSFDPAKVVAIHGHHEDPSKHLTERQAIDMIVLTHKYVKEEMQAKERERFAKDPSGERAAWCPVPMQWLIGDLQSVLGMYVNAGS